MSLFTFAELRSRATSKFGEGMIKKSYAINESRAEASEAFNARSNDPDSKIYQIFLSHSIKDRIAIGGLKLVLDSLGFTTYVDWICDPLLDRNQVSKKTSERLKMRMDHSKSLVYAFSSKSIGSIWMPWELGYVHGHIDRCAVLRIEEDSGAFSYKGFEYLELYPYVAKIINNLNVHRSATEFATYSKWILDGKIP